MIITINDLVTFIEEELCVGRYTIVECFNDYTVKIYLPINNDYIVGLIIDDIAKNFSLGVNVWIGKLKWYENIFKRKKIIKIEKRIRFRY